MKEIGHRYSNILLVVTLPDNEVLGCGTGV